jgi:hypothetical protein
MDDLTFEQGSPVWLASEVKDGMFPTERYVRVEIPDESDITGFIPSEEIQGDRVRAVVHHVVDGKVVLLFRGELLSRTNPVVVAERSLQSIIRR